MAKFYNCSDKFLWCKGIAPILFFSIVGFGTYLLVILLHKPIVNIKNTALTLSWAVFTLGFFILWEKKTDRKINDVKSWTDGYICEWAIKRILLKLNDDTYILYDVKIPGYKPNIDFVVLNDYGVFALEVKKKEVEKKYIARKHRKKAKKGAVKLQGYLWANEIKVKYVYPVLIYALKGKIDQTDNDNIDVLGKEDIAVYFNKNTPARKNKILNKRDMGKIIQLLCRKNNV